MYPTGGRLAASMECLQQLEHSTAHHPTGAASWAHQAPAGRSALGPLDSTARQGARPPHVPTPARTAPAKKNKKQGPMARSHRGARKLGWAALPPINGSWPTRERQGTAQVPRTARGKSIPAAVRGWRRPTLCSCQSPELPIFVPGCSLARSHGLTARINVEIIGHMGQTENG